MLLSLTLSRWILQGQICRNHLPLLATLERSPDYHFPCGQSLPQQPAMSRHGRRCLRTVGYPGQLSNSIKRLNVRTCSHRRSSNSFGKHFGYASRLFRLILFSALLHRADSRGTGWSKIVRSKPSTHGSEGSISIRFRLARLLALSVHFSSVSSRTARQV